jgi:hypothetical protein
MTFSYRLRTLRKTQKIVWQEVVRFSLQIITAIMLPDYDPHRLPLLADIVRGSISLDVGDGGIF